MQLFDLSPDRGAGDVSIIEEHVTACVFQMIVPGRTLSDCSLVGSAIHKKQAIPALQCLHQPGHMAGMAGQQAPLMIIDARNFRKVLQIVENSSLKRRLVHVQIEHDRFSRLSIDRLHG